MNGLLEHVHFVLALVYSTLMVPLAISKLLNLSKVICVTICLCDSETTLIVLKPDPTTDWRRDRGWKCNPGTWPYFQAIHNIMGQRDSTRPLNVISTTADSDQDSAENDGD